MENASKALLIAGELLIAMLVLAVAVYIVSNVMRVSDAYEHTMSSQEIDKFNSHFTKYEGRWDITAQEIVSTINYAKQFNEEVGTVMIKVEIRKNVLQPLPNPRAWEPYDGNPENLNTMKFISSYNDFLKNSSTGKYLEIPERDIYGNPITGTDIHGNIVAGTRKPRVQTFTCVADDTERHEDGLIKKVVFKETRLYE